MYNTRWAAIVIVVSRKDVFVLVVRQQNRRMLELAGRRCIREVAADPEEVTARYGRPRTL